MWKRNDEYIFSFQFGQDVNRKGSELAERVLKSPNTTVHHLAQCEDALHHHRPALLQRVLKQSSKDSIYKNECVWREEKGRMGGEGRRGEERW